jgi:hypothetical protein
MGKTWNLRPAFLKKSEREPGENSLNLHFSLPAFSGCFDYVVACAPTSLNMTGVYFVFARHCRHPREANGKNLEFTACFPEEKAERAWGEFPESAFFTASILGMFRLRDAVFRASLHST